MRLLDYAWHLAHSYRLSAVPWTFGYYPVGAKFWDETLRPKPKNFLGKLDPRRIDMTEFDVVMSHLDNWCDKRTPERAAPFRAMNALALDAPQAVRVCIMHGTPDNEDNREQILRLVDGSPGGAPFVVTNSEQAFQDWGFERSRAIIHGYDVDEFSSSKERLDMACTVCSAGTISRTYHGVPLLEAIRHRSPVLWVGYSGDIPYFQTYQLYREFLSQALIYVHTGQRSPMPGARTEAALSGCCIVSTRNNDWGQYVENGYNGFICETVEEFTETLDMLHKDRRRAYEVGKRGRDMARQAFNKDRFVEDWLTLLEDLGCAGVDQARSAVA